MYSRETMRARKGMLSIGVELVAPRHTHLHSFVYYDCIAERYRSEGKNMRLVYCL